MIPKDTWSKAGTSSQSDSRHSNDSSERDSDFEEPKRVEAYQGYASFLTLKAREPVECRFISIKKLSLIPLKFLNVDLLAIRLSGLMFRLSVKGNTNRLNRVILSRAT